MQRPLPDNGPAGNAPDGEAARESTTAAETPPLPEQQAARETASPEAGSPETVLRDTALPETALPETETSDHGELPWAPPVYEPVPPPPPVPPDALRPWYYREWFLVPTFVWWPSSAILLLRSPWHNGVVMGTLSWFWLIVGGMWIFLRVRSSGTLVDETLWALAAPGILLTIITQSLWLLRHRPRIRRIREAGGFADYADQPDDELSRSPIRPEPSASRRRANRGNARSRRRRR